MKMTDKIRNEIMKHDNPKTILLTLAAYEKFCAENNLPHQTVLEEIYGMPFQVTSTITKDVEVKIFP